MPGLSAAASGSTGTVSYVLGGIVIVVVAALVLGIARSGMGLMCNRQTEVRRQKTTLEKMNEFFFDQPADEETGIPATQGWTTKVDTALRLLVHGQARGNLAIGEVVREVKPDSNGGENLRGVLERTAEATGVKITKQTEERERVQLRDAVRDTQS